MEPNTGLQSRMDIYFVVVVELSSAEIISLTALYQCHYNHKFKATSLIVYVIQL